MIPSALAAQSIAIEECSLSTSDLIELLRPHEPGDAANHAAPREHLVVALVDRRHLYRSHSISPFIHTCVAHCFSGYVGHCVHARLEPRATHTFPALS